jgi:aspartyl/asparaginyl-tRNA synthetase
MKDEAGNPLFPDTMGGGIGIERTLYAICRGDKIDKIDDVTFFGKNPDSHPIFLF